MSIRTRFEPSPSGSIHVGTAMMASFNWFYARRHGGAFVLRVADTDASRVVAEGLRSVTEDLRWLGLQWDEGPEVGGPHGPYFQSERGELYRDAAERLLESGHAYRCYCTPDELDAARKAAMAEKRPPRYSGRCRNLDDAERRAFEAEGRPSTVRFKVEPGETRAVDLVRGEVVFEHEHIDDFVILRADGSALYMLAVSYDDMAMEITHIIRGEDIFASTPKQIMLMRALGAETVPQYGHAPLIVAPDRRPLSKRHGDTDVGVYREKGYLPEVLLNYLVTLDWSVGDGVTEKFSIDELIRVFDPSGITRTPSAFDIEKLTSWNGDRIRAMGVDEFIGSVGPYLDTPWMRAAEPTWRDHVLHAMAPLIQERMKRLDEARDQLRFFFEEPEPDARAAALLVPERADALQAVTDLLKRLEPWSAANIQESLMG
ncbi:MAG TPA: glutamate--tRNA ligase, partial [Actinomycetota bacterium]|nr:glutamate--tRNA ligase [Actinomycetota bacterium]